MPSPPDKKDKTLNQSIDDPTNWKWGVFYFNPADNRVLPPKRNPVFDWTFNFANTRSVFCLVLFSTVMVAGNLLLSTR